MSYTIGGVAPLTNKGDSTVMTLRDSNTTGLSSAELRHRQYGAAPYGFHTTTNAGDCGPTTRAGKPTMLIGMRTPIPSWWPEGRPWDEDNS